MVDVGVGIPARRGGALWWVLAAVGCGLVAGYVAVTSVTAARRETGVVIARADVPPLTRVTGSDVALVQVPVAALPVGALRTTAAAVGHFTRMGLVPGEVVTTAALGGGVGSASGFDVRLAHLADVAACTKAAAVPAPATAHARTQGATAGCRDLVAMALPASADQGFQIIRGGDRVDVAATYPVQQGTVAQIVAANVPVIDRIGNAQGASPTIPGSKAAALGASSGWLILGLTPAAALRVHLAETSGKVAVFLQAPGAPAQPASITADLVSPNSLAAAASQAAPVNAGTLPPRSTARPQASFAPPGGVAGGARG